MDPDHTTRRSNVVVHTAQDLTDFGYRGVLKFGQAPLNLRVVAHGLVDVNNRNGRAAAIIWTFLETQSEKPTLDLKNYYSLTFQLNKFR
jgi:mannose/cellobiose epimerase-like protein (N-acyl-D-glucosamine 2-epimerase family)